MPKRFYSPFNTLVLLAVTLGIIHLSTSRCFSADTYTVPQMAAVTLAWDPNEPAPDGYCIYQRAEGQSYDYGQPSWTGSGTSGTVYNLDWDTTYYFVVRAHAGAFQSADSEEVAYISSSVNGSLYRQLYSVSSDRSNPETLDGAVVDGPIYSFVEPITDIKRAEFFIDGVLHQTENIAPYDLSGGSANLANPFDTTKLNQGLHTISVQITKTDGSSEIINAEMFVSNSMYRQFFSISSDRSKPAELDWASVDGLMYAFVEPITDIKRAEFFIDGVLHQTENIAPYDLSGGSANLANPFDTAKLSQGSHTISVQITKTDGSSDTIKAKVIVDNPGF